VPELTAYAFESFGVPVAVATNDDAMLPELRPAVPPGAREVPLEAIQHRLVLRRTAQQTFDVRYDIREGEALPDEDPLTWVATAADRDFALALLDSYVHNTVALHAPEHVFVQAAVVADQGRAIVLPGKPLTGRTTLAAVLVEAGCGYVSDEYAVLDSAGRVHAYPRPLPGADGAGDPLDGPLPVAAVIATSYQPGAEWAPVRRSRGEGLLTLMSHVIGAQQRPERTMEAMKAALESDPEIFETPRGEAQAAASALLDEIRGTRSQ
jgi:hypothetical protein